MNSVYDELQSLLGSYAQQHVLQFWSQLDLAQQQMLSEDIRRLDLEAIFAAARTNADHDSTHDLMRAVTPPAVRLRQPVPLETQKTFESLSLSEVDKKFLADTKAQFESEVRSDAARQRGAESLQAGQIGCLLVAGGQGSRLGFDHPKGMFSIGPVSGVSLFQILLEKIVAARDRYGAAVPLYLMTSPATHDETVDYLREQQYFGLAPSDVHIFCQGTLPALDAKTLQLLLSAPGQLALSPDGHGGMLAAVKQSGGLDDMRRRGLRHLFYFQVDNPLAQVCDPETIGAHLLAESEYTAQVVTKREPRERVGVVVSIDGTLQIIEYSDLPAEAASLRDSDGGLKLWAGSIAVNIFAVDLLCRLAADAHSLPLHRAIKKVPYIDEQGRPVEPTQPNAIKLERFIFDMLPHARQGLVFEVDPAAAFAPVKNAAGESSDTPEIVQRQMMAQARQWLRAAGITVADGVKVEISPRFALDADELARKIKRGTVIAQDTYLNP